MMQSESINELAAALVAAQAAFSAVPKGSVNPFFKSKYAALPDVVASAGPVLAKNGLAVAQFMSEEDTLVTYVLHSSGQFIAHRSNLHLVKDDPQAQGSAVTYARRYAYMSALGLVADEDDDGNRASAPRQYAAPAAGCGGPADQGHPAQQSTTPTSSNEDFDLILRASVEFPDHEFIGSLARQIIERGTLSPKQISSGVPQAMKLLGSKPARVAVVPEFSDAEDRF